MSRPANAKERRHMQKVAELGCIICGDQAQIHHAKTHMGGGRDHLQVIPLCVLHHTGGGYGVALHAGKKVWSDNFGTEEDLLLEVAKKLTTGQK